MKKPIKVYLQYPWKFPDSPYYKYLIDSPPKDTQYLNIKKQKGVITDKRLFWLSNFLKRNIRRFANKLNLSIPNVHLSPKGDYDLIHCAHCLSKNKDKPWVADFEGAWQMFIGERTKSSIKKVRKILLGKNCRKIIAWTKHTKNQILKEFPEIENKIKVVYPAIPCNSHHRINHKEINLLFIGRYFYEKGGLHALEVIDKLTKEYKKVKGIVVSDIPSDIIKKFSGNKKIEFYNLMPKEKLFSKIYPISDILIYPGYSDSFGFIFLEAMSFGIPIVTVEGFARKEIVENNKTGFIVARPRILWKKGIPLFSREEEFIKKLTEKTSLLIKNKKLRDKMSQNCIEIIKNGEFSIKERNKKLKEIYNEALK